VTGRAAAALALVGLAGCAFGGRSRAFESTRLTTDPGWVVAAPTPTVRQEGSQDCGAASLAMVAGCWRVELSLEGAVAALSEAAAQGARLGDLRDVARAHGLQAFAIAGDRDTLVHELRAGRPVIVGLLVRRGPRRALSHYEVIVAVHAVDDRFVTIDPATGSRVRSWADLDAEWLPAGRPALVVVGAVQP
jgi:ABC-type bacteriocin/lantibiotic exporter with double-glycine peptidase domain